MARPRTELSVEPKIQEQTQQSACSQSGSPGRGATVPSMFERRPNLPHIDLKNDSHLNYEVFFVIDRISGMWDLTETVA
jgi:hypothetical protein